MNVRNWISAVFAARLFACVSDFKSYYDANISLLDFDKAKDLFNSEWPIYTRTNDSCTDAVFQRRSRGAYTWCPTAVRSKVRCKFVIGRGVIIKKGAVVEDSVILPGVTIGEDVCIRCAVVDKKVKAIRKKELIGEPIIRCTSREETESNGYNLNGGRRGSSVHQERRSGRCDRLPGSGTRKEGA